MINKQDRDKPVLYLRAPAPPCPNCSGGTKLWMIVKGPDHNLVTYRCEKCRVEVQRTVSK